MKEQTQRQKIINAVRTLLNAKDSSDVDATSFYYLTELQLIIQQKGCKKI